MKRLLACALLLQLSAYATPNPGDILPPWSEGCLDIHHIHTGQGESTFFILPDGTTMLVDAGVVGANRNALLAHPPVPDASRAPGEWIARYINRAIQPLPKKILNYVMLSHFHSDHLGLVGKDTKKSAIGDYLASGLTEVADHIPFEKFIDRSWSADDTGTERLYKGSMMQNYKKFLAWQRRHKGMEIERFKVGVNDQIVLRNNPAKYPGFEIRNIAAGGIVWTGRGTAARNALEGSPEADITENKLSIAFRLSYGPFKYFTGGDLSSPHLETAPPEATWMDIETPVAQATGPVDVMKAGHHAYIDSNNVGLLRNLRPRVIVVQTWEAFHASPNVMSRMRSQRVYPGPRDIFITGLMEMGAAMNRVKPEQASGHIVIRVAPGGNEYTVYRLTDADESNRIKAVSGPYQSK